jgi:hypothetical protein
MPKRNACNSAFCWACHRLPCDALTAASGTRRTSKARGRSSAFDRQADFVKLALEVSVVPILLQKSPPRGARSELVLPACSVGSNGLEREILPAAEEPSRRSPRANGEGGRRLRGELGPPTQVLSNRCQRELVLCASRPAQTQTAELQDAFQMGEQHLDALAIAA